MARPKGWGCPCLLELMSHNHLSQTPDTERQDLMFVLLGFALPVVPSILSMSPFPPFGIGMFVLCHFMLELCTCFFIFTGAHSKELPWVLGVFELGLLDNVGTVKTMGTLGDGLNAFCVMRWPWTYGGQNGMLWFMYEMSSIIVWIKCLFPARGTILRVSGNLGSAAYLEEVGHLGYAFDGYTWYLFPSCSLLHSCSP